LRESKNHKPKEHPLILRICQTCGLGQLGEFESPEEIFKDYPYLSSTSQTWLDANRLFATQISNILKHQPGDLVVELASNDGYLLKHFQDIGYSVLGVEPAVNVANIALDSNVPTIAKFFTLDLARELKHSLPEPRVVIAKNVMAHVPDLRDFVAGIAHLSGPNSVIIIEAPTITQILIGLQFDTIYHEHFSYLSVSSLRRLFSEFDLELVGLESVATHGGSSRLFARKVNGTYEPTQEQKNAIAAMEEIEVASGLFDSTRWREFAEQVEQCISEFRVWLGVRQQNTLTIGYGAAAKGVTLLAAAEAKQGDLDYVIDNSPAKAGMLMPVVDSEIKSEQDFILQHSQSNCRYVIFPWNLKEEIEPRIRAFDPDAEVVVAIPNLTYLR
jgi:hypothetical protein